MPTKRTTEAKKHSKKYSKSQTIAKIGANTLQNPDELDLVLKVTLPLYTDAQRGRLKHNILKFISGGLQRGESIALVKDGEGQTELRVLRVIELGEGS